MVISFRWVDYQREESLPLFRLRRRAKVEGPSLTLIAQTGQAKYYLYYTPLLTFVKGGSILSVRLEVKTFDTRTARKEGSLAQNHLDSGHSERHGDVAPTMATAKDSRNQGAVGGNVLHLPRHPNLLLLGGLLQAEQDALLVSRSFGSRQLGHHRSHRLLPPLRIVARRSKVAKLTIRFYFENEDSLNDPDVQATVTDITKSLPNRGVEIQRLNIEEGEGKRRFELFSKDRLPTTCPAVEIGNGFLFPLVSLVNILAGLRVAPSLGE